MSESFMKRFTKKIVCIASLVCAVITTAPKDAPAVCKGIFFNPVTDVCWECMLPIKVAGVVFAAGMDPAEDVVDPTGLPICTCFIGPIPVPGLPTSFWEPARFLETVKDPFCFPTLGIQISSPTIGFLSGGNFELGEGRAASGTFAQAHIINFPIGALLGAALGGTCATTNNDLIAFSIPYISEVDPTWNDDILMAFLEPETFLFANPIAALSCIADAVASNIGMPLDPLFWCAGSWEGIYPLTGLSSDPDYVQANALLAARSFYRLGRVGLLFDTALDPHLCLDIPTPIWVKSHYKLQIMRPATGRQCVPIGRSSMIWGSGKNLPFLGASDNFSWILFRKKACCAW